jgi:hypothetical protein
LTVARCEAHSRAFTLYPVGWTPYGRAPLDGSEAVFGVSREVAGACSLSAVPGVRRTQVRAIRLAALWLGLAGAGHESVASALDLDRGPHAERRVAYGRAPTWHRRARLVSETYAAVRPDRRIERLLRAGFRSGVLGRPWGVDSATGALMVLVSSAEAAALRPRSGASTTLPAFGAGEGAVEDSAIG